ncbi:hypothetical protein PVAND_003249 [Polypedilum vanderplanki]|uniref:Uncharacterized protein n=1 Tax=Polypedilum vanderplanki TaxID=319348 RepID=A0A9J6BV81_POLVA|nr:hypothetical protein PVAND_003249 [Polypedilum vanderplanki]
MEIDIDALDIVYEEEISASSNQPTTSDLNILSSASEQYQTQHLIEPFSCHYYNEVSSVQSPPHIQSSQFNFKEFISYLNVLNEPALKILKEENHPAWINVQIIQQQIDFNEILPKYKHLRCKCSINIFFTTTNKVSTKRFIKTQTSGLWCNDFN